GVYQVVILVRITADDFAILVSLIFVVYKLLISMRSPAAVNNDFSALEPLHSIFHTARPLDCFFGWQAHRPVIRCGFWLCTVTSDISVFIPALQYHACAGLVSQLVFVYLVDKVNGL